MSERNPNAGNGNDGNGAPSGGVDHVDERQRARQDSSPTAEEAKERYVNGETNDLEFENELDAAAQRAHETGQSFPNEQTGQQPQQPQPGTQPPQAGAGIDAGQRATGADRSGEGVSFDDFFDEARAAAEEQQNRQQGGQEQTRQGGQPAQQPQGQHSQHQGGHPGGGHERPAGQQRAQRRAEQGRNRQQGQQGQPQGQQQRQQPAQGRQPGQQQPPQQQQQGGQHGGQPQGNPPDMPDAVKEQNRVDPQQQRQQVLSDGASFGFTYGAGGQQWSFTVHEPQGDAVYDAQDVQAAIPESYTEYMTQQVRQYGTLEAYQEAAMAGEADVRTPTLDGDGMRSVHELLVGVMEHHPEGNQHELAGPQLRKWLQTGYPLGLATIVAIRAIGMLPNMQDVETFRIDD